MQLVGFAQRIWTSVAGFQTQCDGFAASTTFSGLVTGPICSWLVLHNASGHLLLVAKHNVTALQRPPRSSDLSPPQLFLFP
jgi:hypothetical protein